MRKVRFPHAPHDFPFGAVSPSNSGMVETVERRPSVNRTFILWALLWLTSSCAWLALLTLEWLTHGHLSCPLEPGTSPHGTSSWSWLPPGQVCTWEITVDADTYTVTDGPPIARLGIAALLLLWSASILTLGSRREPPGR